MKPYRYLYYFFSYISDVFLKGKWRLYETAEVETFDESDMTPKSLNFPRHKIHFVLPILVGVVVYIGGML